MNQGVKKVREILKATMIADDDLQKFNESLNKHLQNNVSKGAGYTIKIIPSNIGGRYSDGYFAFKFAVLVIEGIAD